MIVQTLINQTKTRKVIVSRTKYVDGYNYYLMLLELNPLVKDFLWNEGYVQKETILSKKKALGLAKQVLNSDNY